MLEQRKKYLYIIYSFWPLMVWGDFNTEELTQNAQADCQNPSL